MYPEQDQIQTQGNDAAPNVYPSPPESENIPKPLEYMPNNVPPFDFNQNPGLEHLLPAPNNPYYTGIKVMKI